MSMFNFICEVGTLCSVCGSSSIPLQFLLSSVTPLVDHVAGRFPWHITLAQSVQIRGVPLLSLAFYLAPVMAGLLLLIVLVGVSRSKLGGGGDKKQIRASVCFEGIKREVQRQGDPLGQRHASSEPPAISVLRPATLSYGQQFADLPCPRCTQLLPAGASFCAHCGVSLVALKSKEAMPLNMAVATLSHPGIKRQHKPNEDSLFATQVMRPQYSQPRSFGLFMVADGMGGHRYGREASQLGIQAMIQRMLPILSGSDELQETDFRRLLIEGVQAANQAIYQRNKRQCTAMGTTITTALVIENIALVANVGDSRTYLYREAEGLRQITKDHSVVAYMVENGVIQPDDIYSHPQRNEIYRCLGEEPEVEVDVFSVSLQPGDTLLLCSDGLWEMVRDPHIRQIVSQRADPAQTSHALIEAALDGGGADNISVIMIQVTQATR